MDTGQRIDVQMDKGVPMWETEDMQAIPMYGKYEGKIVLKVK